MSGLTKQEYKILDTFTKAFPYLTDEEKENLYYFGLGMMLNSKKKQGGFSST